MLQPEHDEIEQEVHTTDGDPRSTEDLAAAGSTGSIGSTTPPAMPAGPDDARRPLLPENDLAGYRSRWDAVQVRFVDEPRDSVKEADALVADLMQRLAETFAEERTSLEQHWEQGTDVSTEDLRIAMQRYRSFFDRLLAA
jgi:hypothetical protein